MKTKEEVKKKLNQIIEKRALWEKAERKGTRTDYPHWFELTAVIISLRWVIKERDKLYD